MKKLRFRNPHHEKIFEPASTPDDFFDKITELSKSPLYFRQLNKLGITELCQLISVSLLNPA